jgi:hypothetical protein
VSLNTHRKTEPTSRSHLSDYLARLQSNLTAFFGEQGARRPCLAIFFLFYFGPSDILPRMVFNYCSFRPLMYMADHSNERKAVWINVFSISKGPLRLALTQFKHIKKHVFVRMGKKCTPASGSSTLPRRTVLYSSVLGGSVSS